MKKFSTPMMRQYAEIKNKYPDCLLFYRMGDFYELFLADALLGSQILNITLTAKAGGKDGKIPMAGVPYHAADTYIAKLVHAGYKVAICEQLSPPNKKGIIKRDVIRIVTPGTILDENTLERKENNYIVSLAKNDSTIAIAIADLSTGYFAVSEYESPSSEQLLLDELSRLNPAECILPEKLYTDANFLALLATQKNMNIFPFHNFEEFSDEGGKYLRKELNVKSLSVFELTENSLSTSNAAALLGYLQQTQKQAISHVKKISQLRKINTVILDRTSIINLELFSTIREHDTKGSLLCVLDQTQTALGGRLLRNWLKQPLFDKELIEERFDAVETLSKHSHLRNQTRQLLKTFPDIERLLSRLCVNLGTARDLTNLKNSLLITHEIYELLQTSSDKLIKNQIKSLKSETTTMLIELLDKVFVDEPPVTVHDGKMIKPGINNQLDTLKEKIASSKNWLVELEKKERERTKINSLKIRFNKVFGFYIEISKTNLSLVPPDYIRKQTLVNAERFITEELKEHEEIILTAEEKINALEFKIFSETLQAVLAKTAQLQQIAENIAVLDCLCGFSFLSENSRYVRPKLLYSGEIKIQEGRHPVVEKLLTENEFVPNDVTLDNIHQSLILLTGPNMAGKSVFIRQVALLVLMAQIGCFVPAKSAHISIVDRIFVRSGASDVITSGLSTFMVEMVETAQILNHATSNSLIIMDEIGRGTSTYDGISIAWAVAEYLVSTFTPPPKTLFATHYHELQELEEKYPEQIKNYHLAVAEKEGEPIFLHTILKGGASHSFGVAVAKMAGIPDEVITNANILLSSLEKRNVNHEEKFQSIKNKISSPTFSEIKNKSLINHILHKELSEIEIATLTPLNALNILSELKEKIKLFDHSRPSYEELD